MAHFIKATTVDTGNTNLIDDNSCNRTHTWSGEEIAAHCSIRHITREEYEALTPAEKMEDHIWDITDEDMDVVNVVDKVEEGEDGVPTSHAVAEKLSGVTSYSTEEIDTGARWINNKKIYKKTIVITKEAEIDTISGESLGIPKIESIVDWEGVASNIPSYGYVFKLDGSWTNIFSELAEWQYCSYLDTSDNGKYYLRCGSSAKGYKCTIYLTVYYTKQEQ